MKKSSLFTLVASAFALLLTVGAAKADLLALKVSGILDGNTLLDSVAIGVDTPFAYEVQFDPSVDFDKSLQPGISAYYAHNFVFTLGGSLYSTTQALQVGIISVEGFYGAEIFWQGNSLVGIYTTTTPAITDIAPAPTVFSGNPSCMGNFSLSLTGRGVLEIIGANTQITSTELKAVPEPSTWAMLGMGVPALLLGAMQLRKRAA